MNSNATVVVVEDPFVAYIRYVAEAVGLSLSVTPRLALFILVPSLLGILSDLVCIPVFFRIKQDSPLYTYLRAYIVTNLIICCVLFAQFWYFLYPVTNSEAMAYINTYIIGPLSGICFLYCSFLDIVILLDRVSTCKRQVKEWLKLIPVRMQVAILAILSVALNVPYYFLLVPFKISLVSPFTGKEYTVWFTNLSPLSLTRTGEALILVFVVLVGALVTVAQIALNITSGVLISRHLKMKATTVTVNQTQSRKRQNADAKTNLMVAVLCSISFAEHVLIIVFNVGLYIYPTRVDVYLLTQLTFFGLSIRRVFDFLFFYKFNTVFRKQFLGSVGVMSNLTSMSVSDASVNTRNQQRVNTN